MASEKWLLEWEEKINNVKTKQEYQKLVEAARKYTPHFSVRLSSSVIDY